MTTDTEARSMAAIEADIVAVRQQIAAAMDEAERLDARRAELLRERNAALLAADAGLPRATVRNGRGKSYEVVISRRTGSTIYTRIPGAAHEQAWRRNKYGESWRQHPKQIAFWHLDRETLELSEETSNA